MLTSLINAYLDRKHREKLEAMRNANAIRVAEIRHASQAVPTMQFLNDVDPSTEELLFGE